VEIVTGTTTIIDAIHPGETGTGAGVILETVAEGRGAGAETEAGAGATPETNTGETGAILETGDAKGRHAVHLQDPEAEAEVNPARRR